MGITTKVTIIGNADGKGMEREDELMQVMNKLHVERANIEIMHNPHFQDGMSEKWNTTLLKATIGEIIEKKNISQVFSFDKDGVSGHSNHMDVYTAIYALYKDEQKRSLFKLYTLHSSHIFSKYIGPFSLIKILLSQIQQKQHINSIQLNPFQTLIYLTHHRSQLTWYRILYSICSQYTYLNQWNQIEK